MELLDHQEEGSCQGQGEGHPEHRMEGVACLLLVSRDSKTAGGSSYANLESQAVGEEIRRQLVEALDLSGLLQHMRM